MKSFVKKFIPKSFLGLYHRALGEFASHIYGNPSSKMVVIGVTGTKGKSSTVMIIGRFLQEAGYKVGWASTATFRVGDKEWLNDTKMTMLGRFALQKLLARMVDVGCTYAIVETSSEGIAQFRHRAINYDAAVLTNLTPEHLDTHGGFENYKQAKQDLFQHLMRKPRKAVAGKLVEKIIVANADSEHIKDFIKFSADKKVTYSIKEAIDIHMSAEGTTFTYKGTALSTRLLGTFNVYNILAAIRTVEQYDVPIGAVAKALVHIDSLPGRMEFVQHTPFAVIVDYAHEPTSTKNLYETAELLHPARVIQVFGSTGGGRDIGRRAVLGELAGVFCAIVVVTTDDPYDDDPQKIAEDVAVGAQKVGKQRNKDLFIILDRAEAIKKAIQLAQPNDVVLITGKGSEQAMIVKGKKIPWDDRAVARESLKP
jgi:UDP-N-acetylmuramoyl-L-alanyl-D-glutamate--2,6-diaminopimelate ligase